jgi:hypothetical protein
MKDAIADWDRKREAHWERSNELADSLRRHLALIQTGGITALLATAASFAERGVNPRWSVVPMSIFIVGIVCVAIGYFMAQHRALVRAAKVPKEVSFPWYQWGTSWNWAALLAFISGAVAALWQLSCLVLPAVTKP